jgi:signal transduction histidine kinase
MNSCLYSDPVVRAQLLAQAAGVISDVCDELRGEIHGNGMRLARHIGFARAAAGIHPSESLRAAATLFGVLIRGFEKALPVEPGHATVLVHVADALNRAVNNRLTVASISWNRYLVDQIQQARLGERQRLARDLHDRLAHSLAVARQSLELHELYLERANVAPGTRFLIAGRELHESVDVVYRMIGDLRTATPPESLEKALRGFAESGRVGDAEVDIIVNGDESLVPPEILDDMFLVIREALRNAFTHAEAGHIVALIDINAQRVDGTVDDDGAGFELTRRSRTGTGLLSMRERVELHNGSATVTSSAGQGTTVRFSIPLPAAQAAT